MCLMGCLIPSMMKPFLDFEPHDVPNSSMVRDCFFLAPQANAILVSFLEGLLLALVMLFLIALLTSIICPLFCLFRPLITIPTHHPPSPHCRTDTMAEGRATSGNKDASKHQEDPLAVLLTKVERTLQQLAVLEAEEQRRKPAKTLSPPAVPPQPPARQAATSAFAFSQHHNNNKARVYPVEEPLQPAPPRPTTELK